MRLDLRSLAACRIITALNLFYEATLGLDWHTAVAFLTDDGLWSRTDQLEFGDSARPSLLMVHGGRVWLAIMLASLALCAVALGIGWRTRLTTIITYIIWYSFQSRNFLIVHSFDDLVQAVLLWGVLGLPWAEVWSVDAAVVSRTRERSTERSSLTQLGLWVNVSVMYFLAGWHKSDAVWKDGSGVLIAIDSVQFRRPLGHALCQWTPAVAVLQGLGVFVRPVELFTPVLIAWPTSVPLGALVRTASVFALLSMHLGIALTMRLNAVGVINVAVTIAFMPSWFWDKIANIPGFTTVACMVQPILLAVMKAASTLDVCLFSLTNAAEPQTNSTLEKLSGEGTRDDLKASVKSSAKNSHQVAEVRAKGTKREIIFAKRFGLCTVRLFPIFYLLAFTVRKNVWPDLAKSSLLPASLRELSASAWWSQVYEPLEGLGGLLCLNQKYKVFSPRPPTEGFWILMPGKLRNGLQVDAFAVTRGEVHAPFQPAPKHFLNMSEEPNNCAAHEDAPNEAGDKCYQRSTFLRTPYATYDPRVEPPSDFGTIDLHDDRWAKYMENMMVGWGHVPEKERARKRQQQEHIRLKLGRWTCRQWNKVHGGTDLELRTFDICLYFVNQTEHSCPANGKMEIRQDCVWNHRCFD
eukprot:TRINITY_DN4773_c0_g1_i2.p1 TRINITY_DN4773_c0_g1~~TRINITY_DN4773_c0_g1_i2.p1  ORF type:complete len:636 (-),score=45.99 TRINITY_DN4773_c0_g1_i2:32-1939(-)